MGNVANTFLSINKNQNILLVVGYKILKSDTYNVFFSIFT